MKQDSRFLCLLAPGILWMNQIFWNHFYFLCPNSLFRMYRDKLFPPHCKVDPFWIFLRYLDHYENVSFLSSFLETRDGPAPACKGIPKKTEQIHLERFHHSTAGPRSRSDFPWHRRALLKYSPALIFTEK